MNWASTIRSALYAITLSNCATTEQTPQSFVEREVARNVGSQNLAKTELDLYTGRAFGGQTLQEIAQDKIHTR